MTWREGHYICEAIHNTGCLVALDIVEVNPSLGDEESAKKTVAVGCSLARSALGMYRLFHKYNICVSDCVLSTGETLL